MSPPEFSIICRTHGGPATNVEWFLTRLLEVVEDIESQLIVDSSQDCTYENRLTVKGRYSGRCTCIIDNNIQNYFPTARNLVQQSIQITGMTIHCLWDYVFIDLYIVAGKPTNLIAESNSTHVTVSWKSPGDPVTGYVIYYQSEGGDKSSVMMLGREKESCSLDYLENQAIYYISIVALSLHLPSSLVGPITVITCMYTCPQREYITITAPCKTTPEPLPSLHITSSLLITSSLHITSSSTITSKSEYSQEPCTIASKNIREYYQEPCTTIIYILPVEQFSTVHGGLILQLSSSVLTSLSNIPSIDVISTTLTIESTSFSLVTVVTLNSQTTIVTDHTLNNGTCTTSTNGKVLLLLNVYMM